MWFTSRCGEKTFTETGFENKKKAVEKFRVHENSHSHKGLLKWTAQRRPTVGSQLSTQLKNQQKERQMGLLKGIRAIQYLTRQGISLQGHVKSDGNLHQLMLTLIES